MALQNTETSKTIPKNSVEGSLPSARSRIPRLISKGLVTRRHLLQHIRHSYSVFVDVD